MAASRRDHPLSAPGIPAVTPVLGRNRVWLLPADADYSMIFEVDFSRVPGASLGPFSVAVSTRIRFLYMSLWLPRAAAALASLTGQPSAKPA
jgi:hypothetical protein